MQLMNACSGTWLGRSEVAAAYRDDCRAGSSVPLPGRWSERSARWDERGRAGELAGGVGWPVESGQLPAGHLALQRTPLVPGRPGQGTRLLRVLVLLSVFIPREARVRCVPGRRLSGLSDFRLRLVVQLLLARSAVGSLSHMPAARRTPSTGKRHACREVSRALVLPRHTRAHICSHRNAHPTAHGDPAP